MKTAVVIGASSGMGREIAVLLAKNGYQVAITGRRRVLLEEVARNQPESFFIYSFDCRKANNHEELEQIREDLGHIDLLFLSAGTGEINKSLDFDIENHTISLNVKAFTEIVTWAFNYFQAAKKGHLAVITSIAGIRGGRVAPAYNASKAYQIAYLQGLRQRAQRLKLPVIVTDIRAGFVDTAMAKGGRRFWVVPVQKASRQIYRHLKNKRNVAYVSKRWRLIALLLKAMPSWTYERL